MIDYVAIFIFFFATFFSAIVLVFFIVAGEIILTVIEISLPAFQIAGGIVVFLFALSMIFVKANQKRN